MSDTTTGNILGNILLIITILIVLSTFVGVDVIGYLQSPTVSSVLSTARYAVVTAWNVIADAAAGAYGYLTQLL